MAIDFQKEIKERELIRKMTKKPRMAAIILIFSTGVMGLLAFFLKIDPGIRESALETIYGVVIFIIILILIAILSIRKTLYYSTRFIKENDTLEIILRKWARIDIILLASGALIPILGLTLSWLGMPFDRTGFIFLVSGILMIILMPVGIKVRGKLEILRKHIEGI